MTTNNAIYIALTEPLYSPLSPYIYATTIIVSVTTERMQIAVMLFITSNVYSFSLSLSSISLRSVKIWKLSQVELILNPHCAEAAACNSTLNNNNNDNQTQLLVLVAERNLVTTAASMSLLCKQSNK